jgi:hypothetical protein
MRGMSETTTWPERPNVGDRPVIWWPNGSAHPADPQPGDFMERLDSERLVWTGSEWVPESEWQSA